MGTTHLSGLAVAGVPTMGTSSIPLTNGNVWFVDSGTGSNGNIGSADSPLATTAQAISLATANNGDIIVWCPGHAETITAAGGITVNKAGLTFWGLGEGAQRPTFTSTTATTATFLISSANTLIGGNVVTICNIASQVTFFSVSAADVTIGQAPGIVEHHDTSSSVGAIVYVTTTAAAVRFNANIAYFGFTASVIGTAMLSLVGASASNITVNAYGSWSTAIVNFATTASVNVQIAGYFYNGTTSLTKAVVDTVTGSTWAVQGYDGVGGIAFDGGSGKAIASSDVSTAVGQTEAGVVSTNAGTMVSAATIFTVAGGPVMVTGLVSICQTANDTTASTLQYATTSTLGSLAGTISGASATLASAVIGTVVTLIGTALNTAPVISATGVGLMTLTPIVVQPGIIKITIAVGSTTGTWKHYLRYKPMVAGATVS